MGFKKERKAYKLVFEDPQLDGLEVIARGLSVGELLKVNELDKESLEQGSEATKQLLKMLTDHIIGWNLEDEKDKPVKPSYEYLMSEDFEFTTTLLHAWLNAVASVSPNLEKTSNPSSLKDSLPMETL